MKKTLFLRKFSNSKFSWGRDGKRQETVCLLNAQTTLFDILRGAVLFCLSRSQRNYHIIELSVVWTFVPEDICIVFIYVIRRSFNQRM